jgi:hypothetical protein
VREIDRALAEVEEEVALTREVTNLCDADLQLLEAEETGALRQAAILRTRKAYARREALAREETQALESERQRVQAELASLEQEAQEFQMQVALLEREIESLQRSDMLIDIARQRRALEERTITTRATTALERVHRAIDERREEQAEQLRAMQLEESNLEYEARARLVLHQS